jgi:hypothetical protein
MNREAKEESIWVTMVTGCRLDTPGVPGTSVRSLTQNMIAIRLLHGDDYDMIIVSVTSCLTL